MEHCQNDLGRATLSRCHGNDNGLTMSEIFDPVPYPLLMSLVKLVGYLCKMME